MRIIINLFILTLLASKAFSQIEIGMKFPTPGEAKVLESQINSIEVDTTSLIVNINPLNSEEGKRKMSGSIYKRPASDFPLNLHVWYLFEPNSAETSNIIYNWGLYNPSFNANENTGLLFELNTKEKDFVQKFESLYTSIESKFGEPSKVGEIIDKPHILVKKYTWETPEGFVTLDMEFAREIKQFPRIGFQTNNFEIQVSIKRKIAM
jgi:hypothetical protein